MPWLLSAVFLPLHAVSMAEVSLKAKATLCCRIGVPWRPQVRSRLAATVTGLPHSRRGLARPRASPHGETILLTAPDNLPYLLRREQGHNQQREQEGTGPTRSHVA